MNEVLRAGAAIATIVGTVVAILAYVRDSNPSGSSREPFSVSCTPSFDCNVDTRKADQLVCRVQDLCERDLKVAYLYWQARQRLAARGSSRVQREQRRWWSEERNNCVDADCLRRAYDERIAELEREVKA